MKLQDWMSMAIPGETWAKMERTIPGALSKALDQILYNLCEENIQNRGVVLKLSNSEHMYVGFKDEWPRWEGKGTGKDVACVEVRKTLREIKLLLEAYAFAETQGGKTKHACSYCQNASP